MEKSGAQGKLSSAKNTRLFLVPKPILVHDAE